jgi:hypothetical protein
MTKRVQGLVSSREVAFRFVEKLACESAARMHEVIGRCGRQFSNHLMEVGDVPESERSSTGKFQTKPGSV